MRIAEAKLKPYDRSKAGLDLSGLEMLVDKSKTALVVINDATRPTPTPQILKEMSQYLAGFKSFKVIVATGAHRGPTEAEYHFLLGDEYGWLRGHCIAHDCRSESNVFLGTTKRGTPVLLDEQALEADVLILTGSVEPHYFAGFTGGRKALFPGLAGFVTIKANHSLALSERAAALNLEDNPVHLDMLDCLDLVPRKEVFAVMTVLAEDHSVLFYSAGDLQKSFEDCVKVAKDAFCVRIEDYADIVVTVAKGPMGIDLYQSQKAMDNGAKALKKGGALILVADCPDGIGSQEFFKLLSSCGRPEEAFEKIRAGYKLGYHKSAKMAQVLSDDKVYCVGSLDEKLLKSIFITKTGSVDEGIGQAMKDLGLDNPKVLYLPDGGLTVPVVDKTDADVEYRQC